MTDKPTKRTPAEEMRAAATKLRATAVKPLECIEPICVGDLDEWTKYYGHECEDLPEGDAPWITLMTPLLAEPLAHMLDGYALRYDDEVFEFEGPCCAEPSTCGGHGGVERHEECGGSFGTGDPDDQCPCFHNALVVTRVITGGAL